MKLYVVVTVDDYIPHVQLSTPDRTKALNYAKELAGDWHNEVTRDAGETYFNQKEDGSMEYAVSVQEAEIDLPIKVDQVTRKEVADLASTILWNDGIEEFVPDMVDFTCIAVKDSDISCSDEAPEGGYSRGLRRHAPRHTPTESHRHRPVAARRHLGVTRWPESSGPGSAN
jgi:hypothetical protein